MDPERRDGYRARPARVGAGRAPARAAGLAFVLVGLVIVAALKPWGGGSPGAPDATLIGSGPGVGESASAPASRTSASSPDASPAGSSVAADGASTRPADGGDPLFAPLIAALSARSGEWGIGSGGWGISPVSGSPWTGWERVEPTALRAAMPRPRPPSCDDLPWLRVGIVVAVTVPRDLPPDWVVAVSRVDAHGTASGVPDMKQVSPPGNRGVAYLIGTDAGQWRSGAYRFAIRTPSSAVVMDACLFAL